MVGLRRRNQQRVNVDPDHSVTAGGELGTHPPRPASSVQYAGTRDEQGVEQPSLAAQIRAVSGHRPEPVDVPL
jgi:hypothetical protein